MPKALSIRHVVDRGGHYDFPTKLDNFSAWIDNYKIKYKEYELFFGWECTPDYDGGDVWEWSICYYRPETQDEIDKRVAKESELASKKEAQEKKLLEQLKKKYEK